MCVTYFHTRYAIMAQTRPTDATLHDTIVPTAMSASPVFWLVLFFPETMLSPRLCSRATSTNPTMMAITPKTNLMRSNTVRIAAGTMYRRVGCIAMLTRSFKALLLYLPAFRSPCPRARTRRPCGKASATDKCDRQARKCAHNVTHNFTNRVT